LTIITHTKEGAADSTVEMRYSRNLAALDKFQPQIAHRIKNAAMPSDATLVEGRDGTQTYLRTRPDGTKEWFGLSSMPTVSVAEVLAPYVSDGLSIAIPGILSGYEPLFLARKSPRHTAVFIIEKDYIAIKLAMHLYDYAELLDTGRLVFLDGNDLENTMRDFFEEHLGYEMQIGRASCRERV